MKRTFLCLVLSALVSAVAASQVANPRTEALIARGKSLELDTPYVPPPGDALEHHTAGFAKIMCSAVFMTGLDPDFAAENVGYFISPYAERAQGGQTGSGSRGQDGPRHAAEWREAVGEVCGRSRLCDSARGRDVREVHAGRSEAPAARRVDAGLADGRLPASERPAARRHRCRKSEAGRGCGVRARDRNDGGGRRDLEGAFDRRTLRRSASRRPRRSKAGRWARA